MIETYYLDNANLQLNFISNMDMKGSMMLDQVVEALCKAEVQFVCVERIDEYSKVQSEVNLYLSSHIV